MSLGRGKYYKEERKEGRPESKERGRDKGTDTNTHTHTHTHCELWPKAPGTTVEKMP